jgi:hypothetical protein
MTRSEDRWVYPVEGEDPRAYDDAHRLAANVGHRQISHDQGAERNQGLSSDKPGVDVSEREAVDHVDVEPPYAEDPGLLRDQPGHVEAEQPYAEHDQA